MGSTLDSDLRASPGCSTLTSESSSPSPACSPLAWVSPPWTCSSRTGSWRPRNPATDSSGCWPCSPSRCSSALPTVPVPPAQLPVASGLAQTGAQLVLRLLQSGPIEAPGDRGLTLYYNQAYLNV